MNLTPSTYRIVSLESLVGMEDWEGREAVGQTVPTGRASAQPSLGTPASPLADVPLHLYCPPWSYHGCLPLWVNAERKESNEIRLLNWPAFWQNLFLPNRGSHWWDTLGDKLDGHRTEHLLLNEEHCSSDYTDLYARLFLTPSRLQTSSLFMSCQKWSLSHS